MKNWARKVAVFADNLAAPFTDNLAAQTGQFGNQQLLGSGPSFLQLLEAQRAGAGQYDLRHVMTGGPGPLSYTIKEGYVNVNAIFERIDKEHVLITVACEKRIAHSEKELASVATAMIQEHVEKEMFPKKAK